ncbi:MAG: ABC transporter substrate-binding protein [Acidimicrobiia bacterium]|nr:ABC transporter substrate-binding protein [Acidimicrobiia bacterium]
MRKLFGVLVAVGLVVACVAPAGAQSDKGELKVATSLPAPGFWNGDTPSTLDGGFEFELAADIAKSAGYSGVKYSNVSFDALVAGKAKGFDLALSQVTITTDRAKVVAFTVPYFSSDQGILVKTGTTVDESNVKSIQWGVQTATTAQTFLKKKVKTDKKPRSYQETTQAFAALQAGQVDAVLLDTSIVSAQATESNGEFEVVGQFKTGEEYGGILPKGSKLLKPINKAIKALVADGTIEELRNKWLVPVYSVDPTKVPYIQP